LARTRTVRSVRHFLFLATVLLTALPVPTAPPCARNIAWTDAYVGRYIARFHRTVGMPARPGCRCVTAHGSQHPWTPDRRQHVATTDTHPSPHPHTHPPPTPPHHRHLRTLPPQRGKAVAYLVAPHTHAPPRVHPPHMPAHTAHPHRTHTCRCWRATLQVYYTLSCRWCSPFLPQAVVVCHTFHPGSSSLYNDSLHGLLVHCTPACLCLSPTPHALYHRHPTHTPAFLYPRDGSAAIAGRLQHLYPLRARTVGHTTLTPATHPTPTWPL